MKIRKPYWYSIQGVQEARMRIIFPEHVDRRYVFTAPSCRWICPKYFRTSAALG